MQLSAADQSAMQEFLSRMIGREVDVVCVGAASLRGKITKVEEGVLHLRDDADNVCYIAIDKVVGVWEKHDKNRQPGFVFKT